MVARWHRWALLLKARRSAVLVLLSVGSSSRGWIPLLDAAGPQSIQARGHVLLDRRM
jgi:hypothetical protein